MSTPNNADGLRQQHALMDEIRRQAKPWKVIYEEQRAAGTPCTIAQAKKEAEGAADAVYGAMQRLGIVQPAIQFFILAMASELSKAEWKAAELKKQLQLARRQREVVRGNFAAGREHVAAVQKNLDAARERVAKAARKAADTRHSAAGGARDKQAKIRAAWATGKFKSRDECAEELCGKLGMSFSTARKALRNTSEPGSTT